MSDLAREIAKALVERDDPLCGVAVNECEKVIRPIVAAFEAEQAERDAKARKLLQPIDCEDEVSDWYVKRQVREALRLMGSDQG